MPRPLKTALLLMFCAVLLQACATSPNIRTRMETVLIPAGLLSCPEEPLPGVIQTQKDVALYIEELRFFGRQCKAQLDSVSAYQTRLTNPTP